MDASDPKQVRKAAKAAKIAERQRQDTIRNLMSTIAGRAFVHDILSSCHTFVTSFALNALQMAFNEGERNQGLRLLGDIMQVCPDYYVLMMREANERPTDDDNRGRSGSDTGGFGESTGGEDGNGGTQTKRDPNAADPLGYYDEREDAS